MALRATPIPHKATPWVIGGLVTLPFALSWDFTQLDTTPGKHSSAQIVFGFLLYLFIASFMCYLVMVLTYFVWKGLAFFWNRLFRSTDLARLVRAHLGWFMRSRPIGTWDFVKILEEYGWHCSFEDMSGVLHDLKKDLIIEYIGSGNYQFVSQEPEPNGRARF